MAESAREPALFGIAPGADFPRALVAGLLARHGGGPPEALARVWLVVNTRRMQRRIEAVFDDGPARLLPRILVLSDLAGEVLPDDPAAPVSPLRRRLELARLVDGLLAREPDLAPRTAAFDLADSLAALIDEMHGEGVGFERLRELDVSDQSGHWQRSLRFLSLIEPYVTAAAGGGADPEAQQRRAVEALVARWQSDPPRHPVIVAGSTGSRGTTALLMQAVARLPQGAVVLPGFDFDMCRDAPSAWESLTDPRIGEDHPQFRFARLCGALGLAPTRVRPWHEATPPPDPDRNRTLSLVLRPAPVTDQWRAEGPKLPDPRKAMARVTLIEAPGAREEATAIALILRKAVEEGRRAALITPDRVLTRQVAAVLDRWRIVPDDSAGRPLGLTPPGRLLRQTAALLVRRPPAEALIALLKHPLVATGAAAEDPAGGGATGRGRHVLHARDLELHLRDRAIPHPDPELIRRWGEEDSARASWAQWLADLLEAIPEPAERALEDHLRAHLDLTEALATGPGAPPGESALWQKEAGRAARTQIDTLTREARHGGRIAPAAYAALIDRLLADVEVRESVTAHPGVMIWGTLEARAQGAELVIAAGLNEGVWPAQPAADPWLNRKMRHDCGLLLPERRIGLAAHDFQQAAGAPELVITRAVRNAEAETVPARWLNRLTNYLGGISDAGREALEEMRRRGAEWLALAAALDAPEPEAARMPSATRPAPCPPVATRPRRLSITEIKTLVRDPYAIYARHVLGLRPLPPLRPQPEASLRGEVIHAVMHCFVSRLREGTVPDAADLSRLAGEIMEREVPWPLARRLWQARFARNAAWILRTETERIVAAEPLALEASCRLELDDPSFVLTGRIDRVDRRANGALAVLDYKTGHVPSKDEMAHFDPQLPLSALAAARGAVSGVPPGSVEEMGYVGLGTRPAVFLYPVTSATLEQAEEGLSGLVRHYLDPRNGFVSRRAAFLTGLVGDYDHLARHGEWDDTDPPVPMPVGMGDAGT